VESLMLVAAHGGPTMFARIGIMRALNHKVIGGVASCDRSAIDKD